MMATRFVCSRVMELLIAYHKHPSITVRNQLVQLNIGLVRKIAHRVSQQCAEPYEDLEQIGSANASTNGLGVVGDGDRGLIEANVVITDGVLTQEINDWFDEQILSKATAISPKDLKRAFEMQQMRPEGNAGSRTPIKSGSLLEAARKNPIFFKHQQIYFMLTRKYAASDHKVEAKKKLKNINTRNLSLPPKYRSEATTISKEDIVRLQKTPTIYTDCEAVFPYDAWLIDITKVKKARVWYIEQSYSNVQAITLKDDTVASFSFKRSRLILGDLIFNLPEVDRNFLQDNFEKLWDHPMAKGDDGVRRISFGDALDILGSGLIDYSQ